jgi:hypothetical protein
VQWNLCSKGFKKQATQKKRQKTLFSGRTPALKLSLGETRPFGAGFFTAERAN